MVKRYSQKLQRWYVSRGRTLLKHRKGRNARLARIYFGKSGYVAKKRKESQKVAERLREVFAKPLMKGDKRKCKFVAKVSYTEGRHSKRHEFLSEWRGEITYVNEDDQEGLIVNAIRESGDNMSFAADVYNEFEVNVFDCEKTDDIVGVRGLKLAQFKRL